jgi:hypothetical protein
MPEDTADTHEPILTGGRNERLVIELALGVLHGKGHIEEVDDELIEMLRRLYHANPICQTEVKFNGDVLHDLCAARPGEYLAAALEREREEHWQRHEAQRWSCPCGFTFGLSVWSEKRVNFYTLTDSGLFDAEIATCPRCNRNLNKARTEHANGQLGFAF